MKLQYELVKFDKDDEKTYPQKDFVTIIVYLKNNKAWVVNYVKPDFVDTDCNQTINENYIKYWTYLPKLVED